MRSFEERAAIDTKKLEAIGEETNRLSTEGAGVVGSSRNRADEARREAETRPVGVGDTVAADEHVLGEELHEI